MKWSDMITFLRGAEKQGWRIEKLWATLTLFRLINAFVVQTSYVPDEYWQTLEVAHRLSFGYGYMTWEWREGIRGYSYPLLFALLFKVLENLHLDYRFLLVLSARILQAVIGAIGDLYLYKLAWRLFGHPGPAFWTLLCHMSSWYTFYCWPRTLTNSMEAVLTTIALYHYPWWLLASENDGRSRERMGKRFSPPRKYLVVAALACTVRSTAAVLWAPLCVLHLQHTEHKVQTVFKGFLPVAAVALGVTTYIDSLFYGSFVNVHYNFLKLNFLSDVGSFYGTNPWHWYLSQGLIVVFGPQLIPCLVGAWRCRQYKHHRVLLSVCVWTLLVFSYLSHKEHRFLLPLVPPLMCYAGVCLHQMAGGLLSGVTRKLQTRGVEVRDGTYWQVMRAKTTLIALVAANIFVLLYMSLLHQRGTLDVMRFLSHAAVVNPRSTHVAFLMPCHSTPLYSHVHVNVPLRFLTCEPNLNHSATHVDEADAFFADPETFLANTSHWTAPGTPPVSHFVFFSNIHRKVKGQLQQMGYEKCLVLFHAHFPVGRQGNYVVVYCHQDVNPSRQGSKNAAHSSRGGRDVSA